MADLARNKVLILIGGCAGHGKDTVGDMLLERGRFLLDRESLRTDAYAWTLKQVVHLKTGIPWDLLTATKDVKEVWTWPQNGKTIRQLLQDEGESSRHYYGHEVWADAVLARAKAASERISIITDARHPLQEIHGIRERADFADVFAIRVRNPRVPIKRGHPSEDLIADEPDETFDFLLENTGTLEDLKVRVEDVLDAIMLLVQSGKKKLSTKSPQGWAVLTNGERGWPYTTRAEAEDVRSLEQATNEDAMVTELNLGHLKGRMAP